MSATDDRRGHDDDEDEALRLAVAARLQERYRRVNVAAFWLLGFFNNYYYCIILSASESIAEAYGLKSLTALVSWAEIVGGCWVRLLNAFVFTHFGYNWRILIVVGQAVVGVALICVAPICGSSDGFRFALSLIGIASLGNASSYGESAMLGFLDRLPPMTLAGWSSGTGLSGVAAALVYLGMGEIPGMTNTWVFLANLPSMALYARASYRLVTPLRPSELDVAIAAAKGGDDGAHTLYSAAAGAAAEEGADPLVDRAVALFKPSSQWRDASQWGPLALRAPPGFAELEASRKPIVVTYGTNDAAAGDAKPLLANDRHSGRAPPPPPPAVNDDDADDAPARDIGNNKAAEPSSCVDKTLGCLMPGAPVWAVKFTHSVVFWNCLNLFSVYVFEYAIQFLAPYSFPDPKKHPGVTYGPCADDPSKTCGHGGFEYDWATRHAFVLSQFCYQVGVLMSRSSLKVVRIRRVWVLSVVQGVNFVLWLIQAKTMLLSSETSRSAQAAWTVVLLAWMVVVGLMGGASYVNVFYNILNDDDPTYTTNETEVRDAGEEGAPAPPKNDGFNFKELAMNIGALYATAGITVGCLLDVVLSNTLL